jgi:hypothetical protein
VEITETGKVKKIFVAILTGFTSVITIFGCKNINWINLAQYGVKRQFFILVLLYRRVLPSPSEISPCPSFSKWQSGNPELVIV